MEIQFYLSYDGILAFANGKGYMLEIKENSIVSPKWDYLTDEKSNIAEDGFIDHCIGYDNDVKDVVSSLECLNEEYASVMEEDLSLFTSAKQQLKAAEELIRILKKDPRKYLFSVI